MSLETADKAVLERTGSFLENPRMTDVAFKSNFLQFLRDRGYIHQITHPEDLDTAASDGAPIIGYIGYDATAPSLHVGNLLTIMILRRLQQDGPQNVSALAAALNLDGSTVTRQVTALQKDWLIERRRDPRDGRGAVIAATAAGLQRVDAVRAARRSLYGTVLQDYSGAERRELAATLERLTAALDAHMRSTKA